ncbi:MAG: Gfo/Idh/MocA family oxidoreductase [Nitrososphaeria archaeon]
MAKRESERKDPIDFVVITVPNNLHFPVAKAFIEKGINVVCEKPLCLTEEEASELVKLVKINNVQFMVTYAYDGYPMVIEAKHLVSSGQIGEIRLVVAEYPQDWLTGLLEATGQKQATWRTNPKYAGVGGAIGDIGSHIENVVHFISNLEIEQLLAKLEIFVEGRLLDDNAFVLLKYKNGASGNYWSSQIAVGHENGLKIRIFGTEGKIEWEQENPNYLKIQKINSPLEMFTRGSNYLSNDAKNYVRLPAGHPEGYFEAFANLYKNFCDVLIAKKEDKELDQNSVFFPTVLDGARGVQFIHDCVRSNKSGAKWVNGTFRIKE